MGISIALVGLGSFGSVFAELFKSHPLVDRVGLCDREPDRVARFAEKESFQDKFDPRDAYGRLEDVLAADFDAVAIITQPWLHAPQAVQAMEAGKDVYSAVPVMMVPDGEEILDWCDRIVETSRRTGRRYMLGETTCYRPQTMYCRRRAAAGDFGEFVHADAQYFHDVDSPSCNLREVARSRLNSRAGREWLAVRETYADRRTFGGPMHYPTHSISGPMCVMRAHAVKLSAFGLPGPEGDDFFAGRFADETALVRLSNGATLRVAEYRRIGHHEEEMFRLFGTAGSFREDQWLDKESATPLTVEEMRDPLPEEVLAAYRGVSTTADVFGTFGGHGGSHPYLVDEFVSAIAEGRQPAVNAWEAVRYMACGVVAHKSCLRDGERLDVPDWGDAPP